MGFNVYTDDNMFPYLDGYMIGDARLTFTVKDVRRENFDSFGDSESNRNPTVKTVMYFNERPKGFVMNKTSVKAMVKVCGKNTDGWIGAKVEIYAAPERKVFKNIVRPIFIDKVIKPQTTTKNKTKAPKPEPKIEDINASLFPGDTAPSHLSQYEDDVEF